MPHTVRCSLISAAVAVAAGCASSTPDAAAPARDGAPISRAEIESAQRAWCDALVSIASESARGGDAKGLAEKVLSSAYNYDRGAVLFKPTLTHGAQTFRMDKRGALAYFVGGDDAYPDDGGFARKPWTECRAEIAEVVITKDQAIAMGNVHLVDRDGKRTTVDKTFGYVRGPDANLRIVLHHSSLPYTPAPKSITASGS